MPSTRRGSWTRWPTIRATPRRHWVDLDRPCSDDHAVSDEQSSLLTARSSMKPSGTFGRRSHRPCTEA